MKNYIAAIIKHRKLVLFLTVVVTFVQIYQLKSLQVIADPEKTLPQSNPFVITGNTVEKIFGNKLNAVIGITANQGTIFQAPILEKVQRITDRLKNSPLVIKGNLTSLSSRKSKNIVGNSEGMVVTPLMEKIPRDEAAMLELKKGLASNPAYLNLLISPDEKTTLIVTEFKQPHGFIQITKTIEDAVAPERDSSVTIESSGLVVFLSMFEKFSSRMALLFPLALLVIGLIHYEAFRTVQALILPLITALLAVIWSVGLLGFMREPFDGFNAATPILILAIAAGHAVQILKRYYEEYSKVSKEQPDLSPKQRNEAAVLSSLSKVGPVMVVACTVAALGFFSLIVFELKSIRTFGIFTGAGIVSALILELTFIPALRSILPAPSLREVEREGHKTMWDRLVTFFYTMTMFHRKTVYAVVGAIIIILSLGGMRLKIDNTTKKYFSKSNPTIVDDDHLNERMGGTNSLYTLIEGPSQDSIKRPDVLHAMDDLQTFLNNKPHIGKTLSIVDFIKKMNESMNEDKKEFFAIPQSQDLVAQYLLLYSNSGEPGDFDTFVDNDYQRAVITTFAKTDSSSYFESLVDDINAFAKEHFPKDVKVSVGGGSVGPVAINQVMIHEKILNILQIMAAVFFITALVFRSFTAGLFILVPLVAAVFVNFGVMGLLGIPLQIATALISAMAVGIGADYGIYMSYRMREELNASGDEEAAIKKAFLSAGKAALFVSTAVAGGFGVLMLSFGFMIHVWMGFLISIAMLVSSITTLTLFPALIFTFRPKFIFNGKEQTQMNRLKTATLSLLAVFIAGSFDASADDLSASDIAQKTYNSSKVADSTSDATFKLVNSAGQERIRETTGGTKLIKGTTDNMRITTFMSPPDVKGTKTLLIENTGKDDDIWIYLPALKKVRRLVSNNKKDSFVGTDFSYGDVIGHRPGDWNHKIVKSESVDGRDCFVLESTPKTPEVADNSGYSKRVSWIDKESFVALKGEAYDSGNQLLKMFTAKKVEKVDSKNNKWQPMYIAAENVQSNHKTVLEFKNFKANVGVGDDKFTTHYLEKQ